MVDSAEPQPLTGAGDAAWLVLLYQLPAKHSPARVKAWRRLQRVGAVPLKNSAYVLPHTSEAREDFEWIKAEIIAIGGQAMVLGGTTLDDATAAEIVESFRSARGHDFDAVRIVAEKLLRAGRSRQTASARRSLLQSLRRLRERFRELEAIDYFEAPPRTRAAQALDELERQARQRHPMSSRTQAVPDVLDAKRYRGRVWLTRPRPGVDRMSSAWLIRRFIDRHARFQFGHPARNAQAIPFDMFGAEFGHQATHCTFETMARRFGITDPAVAWLGRIVHDLDLKEDAFHAPEKAAVGRMVEGLRHMHHDDQKLLSEGVAMFEALYQSFAARDRTPRSRPPGSRTKSPRRR